MIPSIILLTIRRLRAQSVDVRFQGDDSDKFHAVIDDLPGNWHYKTQPVVAYKTIKPLQNESVEEALVNYIRNEVSVRVKKENMLLRVVFENPTQNDKHKFIIKELQEYFIKNK